MSDEDDILAIVAALEFLESRDEPPAPKSRWKESGRSWCHGDFLAPAAVLSERSESKGGRAAAESRGRTTWKNS